MYQKSNDYKIFQFRKEWYLDLLRDETTPQLNSEVLRSEAIIALADRFSANYGSSDKHVLNDDELMEFFNLVKEITLRIGYDAIAEFDGNISREFRIYLLRYFDDKEKRKGIEFTNGVVIRSISESQSCDEILIEGYFENPNDEYASDLPDARHWAEAAWFGRTLLKYRSFEIRIPMAVAESGYEISFADRKVMFKPPAARLSPSMSVTCCVIGKIMIKYRASESSLLFSKIHKHEILRSELASVKRILFSNRKLRTKGGILGLKVLYYLTGYCYAKKEIRLYFDKLYMGGDNGQYLFEYIAAREKTAVDIYIANKNSDVYRDLKKRGFRVAKFGSIRCRLLALNADFIFTTHAQAYRFCGLSKAQQEYFANKLDAKIYCIQHGLTTQHIPQYQARFIDNTSIYYLASHVEKENLLSPDYGYTDENLRITGLPRYDGLVGTSEKTILFCPTWRRDSVIEGNRVGSSKQYNSEFAASKYFDVYTDLISDVELTEILRESGYKLTWLLHPTMSVQLSDFSEYQTDVISVASAKAEGYENRLVNSALLITDYSGVQFDFANMNKPILYYHNYNLPPTYDEGIFNYETMGFGPILRERKELVAAIQLALASECAQPDGYAKRIADFFEYFDRKNCARIYEDINNDRKKR